MMSHDMWVVQRGELAPNLKIQKFLVLIIRIAFQKEGLLSRSPALCVSTHPQNLKCEVSLFPLCAFVTGVFGCPVRKDET